MRRVQGHRESPKNRSHSGRAIEEHRKDLRCFHQINPQILGKRSRKAIDGDFEWERGSQVSITGQTFLPTKTIVGPLCSRLHIILGSFLHLLEGRRSSSEFDGLCAKQTKEVPPHMAARPIPPQDGKWSKNGGRFHLSQWSCNQWKGRDRRNQWARSNGPNNRTHLPWLECRRRFLALTSQRTRTAISHASSIDQTDGAIAFRSALVDA